MLLCGGPSAKLGPSRHPHSQANGREIGLWGKGREWRERDRETVGGKSERRRTYSIRELKQVYSDSLVLVSGRATSPSPSSPGEI